MTAGRVTGVVAGALLAHDLDGLVDFRFAHGGYRALEHDLGHVARGDVGIDLEGRAEFDLRDAAQFTFRLEARIAGHFEVVRANFVAKTLLQRVAEHFAPNLIFVLLRDDLHRHLAGPESVHLDVARKLLQPRLNFAVDFL
jgi:hypothetical protein